MAKAIATITGTALRPGVSRNKRWYKPEHVAGMVTGAQKRLAEGAKPMVMLTFHEAGDNSREIAASLTGMNLEADGSAAFTADLTDTDAGWDIAKLADTSDGKPAHLRSVSIRGAWTGKVRKERGPDGQLVETADGLELDGIDFTKSPGVDGAAIKTFAWAAGGQTETEERVLITESVQEPTLTITEGVTHEVAAVPDDVREAVRAVFAPAEAHVFENGLCATCDGGHVAEARTRNKQPYGNVTYADPGYQKDKVKRYPLDSQSHIRAAYSYISMPKNAAKYTADQLKRIKGRIKAAMKRIGAKVSAESDVVAGFVIGEAVEAPKAVLEWMGEDPSRSGSWSVSACNGPVNLNMSSYCMDPADLDVILRAAAQAACDALKRLDPDMDGDVDVPGAGGGSDTDDDSGHEAEPEPETPAAEAEPAPAVQTSEAAEGPGVTPAPSREPDKETEAPVTTEATTNPGGSAPSPITEADVKKAASEAAAAAVEAYKAERKAAKKAAKKAAAESAALAPATESAPAAPPAGDLKTAMAEVLESYGFKPPVQETKEEEVARLVKEGVQAFVQEAVATGAVIPGRAGLQVTEHAPSPDEAADEDALAAMSDDAFAAYGGAALDKYMGDNTRHNSLHT